MILTDMRRILILFIDYDGTEAVVKMRSFLQVYTGQALVSPHTNFVGLQMCPHSKL